VGVNTNPLIETDTPLRDSKWAQSYLGYKPEQRVAFWLFAHSNNVPMIRLGPRRIMFDEFELRAWVAARSTGKKSRSA